MDKEQLIDRLWENSGHGTRREDIEAAFDTGAKHRSRCGGFDLWTPVTTQHPPVDEYFFAFGPGLGSHVNGPTMDICVWDGDLWSEHGTEIVGPGVRCSHWMRLPKAPGM